MALQMTDRETLYQRKQFYETLDVHGLPCEIYSIGTDHEKSHDFYGDLKDDATHGVYIKSRITYETLPTIKTLRSLGWYIEGEGLPVVAHIPVLYKDDRGYFSSFKPCIDDRVDVIGNPIDGNSDTMSFLIKDFIGRGFPNTIYYICKLVPYRRES